MPRLHHFTLDPYSRRMRLALNEYGRAADLSDQTPWRPEIDLYQLNPAGTLPIYVEDSGRVICGVEALTEYLEETRNGAQALIPGDEIGRAEVRRLVGWFDMKFYAEVTEPVLTEKIIRRFMTQDHGGGSPDMTRVRKGLELIKAHLDYVGRLADGRNWLAGDHLSLADLAGAAHLSAVDFVGDVPWADFPAAKAWYQRLKSRPSFRPLLADAVRGLTPSASYADLDF
jgi:glutathione S-transferase